MDHSFCQFENDIALMSSWTCRFICSLRIVWMFEEDGFLCCSVLFYGTDELHNICPQPAPRLCHHVTFGVGTFIPLQVACNSYRTERSGTFELQKYFAAKWSDFWNNRCIHCNLESHLGPIFNVRWSFYRVSNYDFKEVGTWWLILFYFVEYF